MATFDGEPAAKTASRLATLFAFGLFVASAHAGEPQGRPLGGRRFAGWTGVAPQTDGSAVLKGEAIYRVPDGPKGWHWHGFLRENDSSFDAYHAYGLRLDLYLQKETTFDGRIRLAIPKGQGRPDLIETTSAPLVVAGKGWHRVLIPFSQFDYPKRAPFFLKFIQEVRLGGRADGEVAFRNVRVVGAAALGLETAVRSKAAGAGMTASYTVTVSNLEDAPRSVALSIGRNGWEAMRATVAPARLTVAPGGSKTCTVTVSMSDKVPPGGRETQSLVAVSNGDGDRAASLSLTTVRRLTAPYLTLLPEEWRGVREKVARYPWAKDALDAYRRRADGWNPPLPRQGMSPHPETKTVPLFDTANENGLVACGVVWQITRERRYAEKAAIFLRRLIDPKTGYPSNLQATNQGAVHEGQFFRSVARSYDMIEDSGALTPEDERNVEATFRLLMMVMDQPNGGISNWSTLMNSGAIYCAMALQDWDRIDAFLNGPNGMVDNLVAGTMDDGWWYEGTTPYNLGVAGDYSQLSIALRPFGIDLKSERFAATYGANVGLRPFETIPYLGMAFDKWGPNVRNFRTIKDLWDCVLGQPDYRGIIYGNSDGHEEPLAGSSFELAYFLYHDPAYAGVIARAGAQRDLLYGVPELPKDAPELFRDSTYADNIGLGVLRSVSKGMPDRERIQAVVKYGTHGSYHGHFDRASLDSLMRYGRSFYNPETSWWSYDAPMYKVWMQASLSHNMVVVDRKMQEPVESKKLLWHTGPLMQALAVETDARWSNPPYLGGGDAGDKWWPTVPKPPASGEVTGYTEPVRQRRLTIVRDDYVVVADQLKGEREHTFDSLMQLRGARLDDASRALGHAPQFDADPLGSGILITDVDRYAVSAPAVIRSEHRFAEKGGDGKNAPHGNWESGGALNRMYNEPGVLKIDQHLAWPKNAEVSIGTYAENWDIVKRLAYEVQGDGRRLAAGTFGTWILGDAPLDLDLTGVRTLRLATRAHRGDGSRNNLVWANARIVTADGRTIPLDGLPSTAENVVPKPDATKDYEGGPIKIAGVRYERALGAEPRDAAKEAVVTLDLTGLNAVRFQTVVGGDFPIGDESQVRKTTAITTKGREATYLTVVEPYEDRPKVVRAEAEDARHLTVTLSDGRVDRYEIADLDGSGQIVVTLTQTAKDGTVLKETTAS